ncbi:MAG: phosphate ABC transporter substrate-binding/OmpA family protein [Pseudomonadota bacterium]
MWASTLKRYAAVVLFSFAATAQADQVVLESFDQSIRLDGVLESFDGESFTVRTAVGPVTVRAADVRCTGESCPRVAPDRTDFMISGSRNLASTLMPSLVEAFSFELDADLTLGAGAENADARMTLETYDGDTLADILFVMAGSSQGLRDLADGSASMALTTRPLRPEERVAVTRTSGNGVPSAALETVLALDGLLIVTAQSNPVRSLSEARIADVFAGRIRNWSELGGPDLPITLYARPPTSGTGSVFAELVLRPTRAVLDPSAVVLDSDAEVSDAVARDPSAIGFTSYSNERAARSLAIRGVCGIQTPATAFTIKTEEYPLTRRLFLYRRDRPLPQPAEEFLGFVGSETAQNIIARTGFVDQGVSALTVNNMGLRFVASLLPSETEAELSELRGMMQDLISAERLSITLRFDQGSSDLDTRAKRDVERLAEMIRSGRMRNKELLLIGFTDSVGRADINAQLSQSRADQALEALRDILPQQLMEDTAVLTLGYGEMSPLGCNETANGRRINRRVEVWTRDVVR